jgi:hypothetical protein
MIHWSPNGKESSEIVWKNGEPWDGREIWWYDNGQKQYDVTFKDGKKISKGIAEWYENGQKKFEGTYKNGKKDGKWIAWYENGAKKEEVTLKNGKIDGLGTQWDENGTKVSETTARKKRKNRPRLTKEQLESIAPFYRQRAHVEPEAVIVATIKRLTKKKELTSEEEGELAHAKAWINKTSSTYPLNIDLLDQISKGEITLSENDEDAIENLIRAEPDNEIADWEKPIYKLAEYLRKGKEKREFDTYKEAYEYGAKHYTVKGQPITAEKLESNYYHAVSAGYLNPPDR